MNMDFEVKLPIPQEVKKMFPVSEDITSLKEKRNKEIKNILSGKDHRKILIVGPCSADREDAVLEYLSKLKEVSKKVQDRIYIIPRVYTSKPRTNGDGYKGFLHQPDLKDKPNLFKGLIATRELHKKAIEVSGMTCADEMLYPENHRYYNDLLGYVAVGARSVEDQQHRMTASGLEIPVGMKNPTSGDFNVMINSIAAAQKPQDFIYRGWAVHSKGNPYAHGIVRGYVDYSGQNKGNYEFDQLNNLLKKYKAANLRNMSVIVDCSHSNSNKDCLRQEAVMSSVLQSCRKSKEINSLVKGFMVESYLLDGKQDPDGQEYGKSITDACLGWDKTVELINKLYDELKDLI